MPERISQRHVQNEKGATFLLPTLYNVNLDQVNPIQLPEREHKMQLSAPE